MFAEVGGCNFYYEIAGKGPPLVLVHGTGADCQSFADVVPILSRQFKVYSYDMRGHGKTVRLTDDPLSDDIWADDLAALMTHLELPSAAISGWSLGGLIAMNFVLRHPRMASCLLLMGSRSPLPSSATGDRSGFAVRLKMAAEGASIEEIVEATFEFSLGAYSPHTVQNNPEAVEKLRRSLLRNDPKSYAELLGATRADIASRLGEIECPTLIVVGEDDARAPVGQAEGLSAAIPNSYMKIMQRCGHFYGFEQPEETCRIMTRFLQAFG
jgi:pimeloyl-ACP methyl ester carboxylesterase